MYYIDPNIKKAKTIPSELYYCNNILEHIKEKIFIKNWQFICDIGQLNKQNNAYPYNFLDGFIDEPLLLTKNNNDNICSMSNVCTHRGNILIDSPCNLTQGIACKYHGRRFDVNGNFLFMPKCDELENFPSKKENLKHNPCSIWKQFIFSSIEPCFPLQELVKEMDQRIGWMPIEKFQFSKNRSKEYMVNANWALYCDNYLEGFHIPFVHKGLTQSLNYTDYKTELFKYSSLQLGSGKTGETCFNLPKKSIDYGKKIAAYYFWLFPNLMFNFYPWGLSINIVTPINPEKTKVRFLSYIWDESKLDSGAGSDLDKVEQEDEEIVEQVQRGVKSRFYNQGHFSPTMETGVHHFHVLLAHFLSQE